MMRITSAICLALLLALPAGAAHAKKKIDVKDELTVSGRFELPKAKASLQDALGVETRIDISEEDRKLTASILKVKSDALDDLIVKAFAKSLANYGYIAPHFENSDGEQPEGGVEGETEIYPFETAIPLTVKINSIAFEKEDDGHVGTVSLSIDGPQACLKADTNASFLALKIKEKQAGRKIFALVTAATFIAVNETGYETGDYLYNNSNWSGGHFLYGNLTESERLNRINTYGADTAIGESYPPKSGEKAAKRHALKNALRLSFARYITLIDQACS